MFCNNGGVYVRSCVFLQRSSTRGVVTRTQNKASCLEKRIISMQKIRLQCRPVFVNASLHCRKYRKMGSSSRICCFYPITLPAQIKIDKHFTSLDNLVYPDCGSFSDHPVCSDDPICPDHSPRFRASRTPAHDCVVLLPDLYIHMVP